MRMNVFEMEGFLRGKCVPRDLKVNETDAEYLVRKFDALEAKCAAQENKVIPVSTELPPANESVLLFDANGRRLANWLAFSLVHLGTKRNRRMAVDISGRGP